MVVAEEEMRLELELELGGLLGVEIWSRRNHRNNTVFIDWLHMEEGS